MVQSDLRELVIYIENFMERPTKWTTKIWDLGDEKYLLSEPIQIVIEEYQDSSVIARFPEVEAFGEGDNEPDAILNLKAAILDLYDELIETSVEDLGKLLLAWRRVLTRLISKV